MSNRLILLGTKGGPSVRATGGTQSAAALVVDGELNVIDCGLGVSRRIVEAGQKLQALRRVFITHHHSDHTLEYGGLLHNAWMNGLRTRVDVYGPPGTCEMTDAFWRYMRFDLEIRIDDEKRPDVRALIHPNEYAPGVVMEDENMRVSALAVPHAPVRDNCALRFELKTSRKTIVFSGDTGYFPPLAEFARGADVLIHEAMHPDGIEALIARLPNANPAEMRRHFCEAHTSAEDAGRIAQAAGAKQLVLTHFVPADDASITPAMWEAGARRHYKGKVTVGRDLFEVQF
jgi:ribonuclease BN (tRNA processing enzyme)